MHSHPEKNDHGLARGPFKSCVVPRPIGWISAVSIEGIDNLAPYSRFQNLGFDPAFVMFSANQGERGKRKDSVVNAEEIGEFVYTMATYDVRDAVNRSALDVPPEVDEFELTGVRKALSLGSNHSALWNRLSSSRASTTGRSIFPEERAWEPQTSRSAAWFMFAKKMSLFFLTGGSTFSRSGPWRGSAIMTTQPLIQPST
jgi:hypothetical protein